MRIALYQPDQAGNVGTILRLVACLGVPVDIVEPCGFPWGDRALRRVRVKIAVGKARPARLSGPEAANGGCLTRRVHESPRQSAHGDFWHIRFESLKG